MPTGRDLQLDAAFCCRASTILPALSADRPDKLPERIIQIMPVRAADKTSKLGSMHMRTPHFPLPIYSQMHIAGHLELFLLFPVLAFTQAPDILGYDPLVRSIYTTHEVLTHSTLRYPTNHFQGQRAAAS